ncbi:MAG: GTP-binding protein [Euryarchaeota archaeon]|nr:GTP-binding protein [Euryarchaeota archaeon]
MSEPIPVTVLSGALGAGKTTTLNHLLTDSSDLNAAVVVNDMGEVNVDAELVERESTLGGDEEIIELSNGCICCRLRGDMLEEIGRLAEKREFDYLLVESSGISEPIPVAQTFAMGFEDAEFDPRGVYELDTMVSVCDAHGLWRAFESGSALVGDGEASGVSQPEEILMDQIEFCDVLLLNKCDLVPDDALKEIESVLRTLQPRAKIVRTEHGKIDPNGILDTGRFDFDEASASAGWIAELDGHDHGAAAEEHGVTSFVYRAKRPFRPERFEALLQDMPEEVIRAKGFFWSAGREDVGMGMNVAGQSVRAGPGGRWVATLPEEQRERFLERQPSLREEWDEKWGDRGTELVFIGPGLDETALRERLDECLLTDEEMKCDWEEYPDPFGREGERELALAD